VVTVVTVDAGSCVCCSSSKLPLVVKYCDINKVDIRLADVGSITGDVIPDCDVGLVDDA